MRIESLFSTDMSVRLCLTLLHSIWLVGLVALAARCLGRVPRTTVKTKYWFHIGALALAVAALPATFAMLSVPRSPDWSANDVFHTRSVDVMTGTESGPTAADDDVSSPAPAVMPGGLDTGNLAWRRGFTVEPKVTVSRRHLAPWLAGLYVLGVALMAFRLSVGSLVCGAAAHFGQTIGRISSGGSRSLPVEAMVDTNSANLSVGGPGSSSDGCGTVEADDSDPQLGADGTVSVGT